MSWKSWSQASEEDLLVRSAAVRNAPPAPCRRRGLPRPLILSSLQYAPWRASDRPRRYRPSRRRHRSRSSRVGDCLPNTRSFLQKAGGASLLEAPPYLGYASPPAVDEPLPAGCAGVAQSAEHLFCKQAVRGSSPLASPTVDLRNSANHRISNFHRIAEGCPSGQREQTVNLPAMPTMVRIHHPPLAGVAQLVERQPSKLNVAGSNPVSRSNAALTPVRIRFPARRSLPQ